MHRNKTFIFACGSSALVRAECEGGTAAWLAGTLAVPSMPGHRLPPLQELCPIRVFFLAPCSWRWPALASLSHTAAPYAPPFRKQPFPKTADRMRSLQAPGCCQISFFKDHAHANMKCKPGTGERRGTLTKRRERETHEQERRN